MSDTRKPNPEPQASTSDEKLPDIQPAALTPEQVEKVKGGLGSAQRGGWDGN